MIATVTNHISKGVENFTDTNKSMIWYKTNFNMPVKYYMTNTDSPTSGAIVNGGNVLTDGDQAWTINEFIGDYLMIWSGGSVVEQHAVTANTATTITIADTFLRTGSYALTIYMRYNGFWRYLTETTTYDLATFVPGYEICVGHAIFDFYNDTGSSVTIDTDATVKWVDSDDSTVMYYIWNGVQLYYASLPAGTYIEWWNGGNIGCAGWEIDHSDDYYFKASASGSPNITEVSTTVTMQNVPSTTQLGSTKRGYIWVEGNNLCIINGNQWKHTFVGNKWTYVSTAKAGYFWTNEDTLNDLLWIGADGYKYTIKWKEKQFASFYGNGPTDSRNPGTDYGGYLWMDYEFGLTHLSYIADDGWKYLTGAGDNPY